jgi:hypothetical protein
MAHNPNMANKEVADLVLLNYKDKKPFLNFDFANVTTTELTAERVYATGGQGAPNRVAFDGQRKGTLVVESQITPMKLYAMLSGTDIATTATFLKREVLTSATKAVTLTETPVAGSVYIYKDGDDCGTALTITLAAKVATISDAGYTDGEVIAYYLTEVTTGVQSVKFNSKTFPKAFIIYGETPWKTEDDEEVAMHLTYYKAQPQSNMSLAFSNTGDPTSVSITFDLMADSNNNIYDMTIVE